MPYVFVATPGMTVVNAVSIGVGVEAVASTVFVTTKGGCAASCCAIDW